MRNMAIVSRASSPRLKTGAPSRQNGGIPEVKKIDILPPHSCGGGCQPTSSLKTLYDPKYMPVDLRQAHEHLDKIVDVAFGAGKWLKDDDSARLKILFDLY